ncbi:Unknown protein, partial [Striga hermonthica]
EASKFPFGVPLKGWSPAYDEALLKFNEGNVPLRRSSRVKFKVDRFGGGEGTSSMEDRKPATRRKQRMPRDPKGYFLARGKQSAEIALSCYNQKHGTNLEYVRFLEYKEREFVGPGCLFNFDIQFTRWRHVNFEARPPNADPNDKPLLLFAELYRKNGKYELTTLSQVNPSPNDCACQSCDRSSVIHPLHGFRAGFVASEPSEPKLMSKEDAVKLAEFALKDYNDKHGTTLKIERILECNSFTSSGPLMDFTVKTKRWVHMNFEVRAGTMEDIIRLFAELYLSDDNMTYVLASLSPTSPSEKRCEWAKYYNL